MSDTQEKGKVYIYTPPGVGEICTEETLLNYGKVNYVY